MMGAAVIMLCVVLLLPMILDHSMEPKLAAHGLTPPPSEAQQDKSQVIAPAVVARPDLPQPAAADTAAAPAPPAPPVEQLATPEAAAIPAPATAVASTVAKPAMQASTPTAGKAAFWVQVGVFSDRGKAQALVKKLADHEIHAVGEEAHYKDGARVRVRIGPLHNKAEALAMTHQLDQLSLKSMVISP
jgi:DedD protein